MRALRLELRAAVGERARRQHRHERAAVVGRAARVGDRARVLGREPAGFREQCGVSAARRSVSLSADGARIGVGATDASTMRASAMAPSRVERDPCAGAGDGDVHLAPRREAQVGGGRSRRRRRQHDGDQQLAGRERRASGAANSSRRAHFAPAVGTGDHRARLVGRSTPARHRPMARRCRCCRRGSRGSAPARRRSGAPNWRRRDRCRPPRHAAKQRSLSPRHRS